MSTKRILIVDDVSVIRGFVKAAIKHLKVSFQEASNGTQAMAMHEAARADLIICDLNMPGMNGEAFLTALREKNDQTPVIMLTVEGDRAKVATLLKLGVQGYILKPFKPAVLAKRVVELLDGTAPPLPKFNDEAADKPLAEEAPEDAPEAETNAEDGDAPKPESESTT